jgi:hypothetical protein
MIAGLTEQRNYLVQQSEEQRSRWESEKDGWARMAEALIAQRNKGGHTAARDEVGDILRYLSACSCKPKALDAEPLNATAMTFETLH